MWKAREVRDLQGMLLLLLLMMMTTINRLTSLKKAKGKKLM